jgi:hypothetical protein
VDKGGDVLRDFGTTFARLHFTSGSVASQPVPSAPRGHGSLVLVGSHEQQRKV